MKQILALAMTLLLLCGSALAAEIGSSLKVVDCNEYISLREEPSKSAGVLAKIPLKARVAMVDEASDGFWKVSYQGKEGYALSGYLREVDDYSGDPVDVDDELRYNINLFLSNFTEVGFTRNAGSYDESYVDKKLLTKFGIDHCWFNRQNQIESGEYFNYNNMRLPEGQIAPIVRKYFGVDITPSHSLDTIDYRKGYYYWEETGGHTSDGFACQTRVEKLGSRRYSVWFNIYGSMMNWNNDVCHYTDSQARSACAPYDQPFRGHAVIDVGSGGLEDRSTWTVRRYTVNFD
jgi:hypothetical protein